MINAQVISEALANNLNAIRERLEEKQWLQFCGNLLEHQHRFENVTDRDELELAADSVFDVCQNYPFVKDLIERLNKQYDLALAAGDAGRSPNEPIQETQTRIYKIFEECMKYALSPRSEEGKHNYENASSHNRQSHP